jgi:mono/diheme cytochrome c family protein
LVQGALDADMPVRTPAVQESALREPEALRQRKSHLGRLAEDAAMLRRVWIGLLLAGVVAACAGRAEPFYEPLAPAERAAMVAEGREIAVSQCGGCHATGVADASPRADAPPLREILERYDSGALAGNLMIGVRVGHPDMPLFHMGPRGVDSLVEYLYSIRTAEAPD